MKTLLQAWQENDLVDFAIALGIVAAAMVAFWLARWIGARVARAVARRAGGPFKASAADAVGAIRLWLFVPLAVRLGATALELEPPITHVLDLATVGALVVQAGLTATRMSHDWIAGRAKAHADGDAMMAMALLGFAARVAIWTLVLMFLLNQLGFNITALVTGLGVGGVAIALAVQNILGDLFASLSIVLDKPFVVGDFIVVDTLRGTVETVGIKTTRIRSLDGEMLVFSNSDLLKSRIRNYRRMSERRVTFGIGVTYQTPPEKVAAIPGMLRDIVTREKVRFDRAHFKEYGDSALLFEVVYYVLSPDFNVYMDIQQAINLAILERFAELDIGFAYPTRTVFLASSEAPAGEGVGRAS